MHGLKLGFHGTFALKKQDLSRVLVAAQEDQCLNGSLWSLVQRTNLGNQKFPRIKSWAVRSGLVSHNQLSLEGVAVQDCDPHLTSLITDWVMHFHLSFGDRGLQPTPTDITEGGGWPYFVFSFLPDHSEFTLDELLQVSAQVFDQESPQQLRANFRYVLRAYTDEQALWSCQFIQSLGENCFRCGYAKLPNLELIGYFLAKLWQRDFGECDTVRMIDILNQPMGLAPILGISQADFVQYLQRLEEYGLLSHTEQGEDEMITRLWQEPMFLLRKAYENNQDGNFT